MVLAEIKMYETCSYRVEAGERHFLALSDIGERYYEAVLCAGFRLDRESPAQIASDHQAFLAGLERSGGSLRFARPADPDRTTGLVVAATILVVVAAGVIIVLEQGRRRRA
jgi:hypothetical protein